MIKATSSWTDNELLQHCAKDDLRAFNLLFDRYAPKLYKLGMRYLNDSFAVEELAIDLLHSIWEKRNTLCLEREFSSYLFRAMHNRCVSFMRRAKLITLDITELSDDLFQEEHGADYALITKDTESSLKEILSRLSPQRRKVFELSREHSMSYAEIARELNLSQNTVENHMVAALSFLRKLF